MVDVLLQAYIRAHALMGPVMLGLLLVVPPEEPLSWWFLLVWGAASTILGVEGWRRYNNWDMGWERTR